MELAFHLEIKKKAADMRGGLICARFAISARGNKQKSSDVTSPLWVRNRTPSGPEEGEFFLRLHGLQKLVIALILRRNLAC
jgi:hypothetical protein